MPRILVADDDRHFRQVLLRLFAAEGWETLEASTGPQALELARSGLPDLLVLDVAMPFLSGDALLRHLREDPAWPGRPALVVSGRDLDRLEGLEGPGLSAMQKPVDLDELLERARELLGL